MSLTKDQIAGITILMLILISALTLNLYCIKLDVFGWFGPLFIGLSIGGFVISLIFFFLANNHFKASTTHHNNKIVGWVCMFIFIAMNIGANYAGMVELARIKHW